jgi:hypothetical protein
MLRFGRKTRDPRRRLDSTGWISVAGSFGLLKCRVVDISRSGAQIVAEDPKAIPASFALLFSRADRRGTPCRVIWRSGHKIGVKFAQ